MYNKNLFGENLKFLRLKYNVEQQELAEELGRKSGSTVSDWERGKATPNAGTLSYIADKFNVSLKELMETDISNRDITEDVIKPPLIPIVGEVAAGSPNYALEDIEGYMTLPPRYKNANGLIYLRVKSDSMDKQFPIGSYALVNTNAEVENGSVAVVKVNGEEATLKQVKFDYDKEKMYLIPNSNNQEHFPLMVDINNGVSLVGKVVGMYLDI